MPLLAPIKLGCESNAYCTETHGQRAPSRLRQWRLKLLPYHANELPALAVARRPLYGNREGVVLVVGEEFRELLEGDFDVHAHHVRTRDLEVNTRDVKRRLSKEKRPEKKYGRETENR